MNPQIAWTSHALQQLHDLHLTVQGNIFVTNHTNNWVHANCANWAVGNNYTTVDVTTGLTVTARVQAINGQTMTVDITSIQ